MAKRIDSISQEQWEQIDKIREKWIARATEQHSDEAIKTAICNMWRHIKWDEPVVFVADSPRECIIQFAKLRAKEESRKLNTIIKDVQENQTYLAQWDSVYAGWFEGGKVCGVEFDQEKYDVYNEWGRTCHCIVGSPSVIYASRNPVEIHWQDGRLHNTSGMSVLYADGTGIWSIEGVMVDEQIVMHPETQTVEQIEKEDNAERKRIRLDRYGWLRYLTETDAEVLDRRDNPIEATREALFRTREGLHVLIPTCKTGRLFAREVPDTIKTCEDAQAWLHSGAQIDSLIKTRVIGRT